MPSIEQLERLLAVDPGDPFVLYGIAQEHAKAGRHGPAIEFFDRCLVADAGYCYAYYHKARSQQALGDDPGAEATLRLGIAAARKTDDSHALGELTSFLQSLDQV